MFKVVLLPKAEKDFARADPPLARKMAGAFGLLEVDPIRNRNIKPLAGPLKGLFRLRAGDYRIVYQIDARARIVYVVPIAHRKDAYQ
jgi:mRNA interferase RelE/StbE